MTMLHLESLMHPCFGCAMDCPLVAAIILPASASVGGRQIQEANLPPSRFQKFLIRANAAGETVCCSRYRNHDWGQMISERAILSRTSAPGSASCRGRNSSRKPSGIFAQRSARPFNREGIVRGLSSVPKRKCDRKSRLLSRKPNQRPS